MSDTSTAVMRALAAPTPISQVEWRPDGRPVVRGERTLQRYVAYVSAQFVRQRLEEVCAAHGVDWDTLLTALERQPEITNARGDVTTPAQAAFHCRLVIHGEDIGIAREDVGTGDDYKSAATDAFKRAGTRCGIASDLYDYEQNWVSVDQGGRPIEDPGVAYTKRTAYLRDRSGTGNTSSSSGRSVAPGLTPPAAPVPAGAVAGRDTPLAATSGERGASSLAGNGVAAPAPAASYAPAQSISRTGLSCPKCGGNQFWDNRAKKASGEFKPNAPDFKCKTQGCTGAIWPDENVPPVARTANRPDAQRAQAWLDRVQAGAQNIAAITELPPPGGPEPDFEEFPPMLADEEDNLPF